MIKILAILAIVFICYLFLRKKKEKVYADPRANPLYDPPLEDGYFRPPCKCHSSLQSNGAIIKYKTYFEDVLSEDWPLYCKLEPTYTKIVLTSGGNEKLLKIFEGPYWG